MKTPHKWRYSNRAMGKQQFDILENIEEKLPVARKPSTTLPKIATRNLIEHVKKHWAWVKDEGVYKPSERVIPLFYQAKPFEQMPPEQRAIIIETLKSEHREEDINDYVYAFAMFKTSELPRSYWQHQMDNWIKHETQPGYYHRKIGEEILNMPPHVKKIQKLEELIVERGYDYNYPLLLEGLPPDPVTDKNPRPSRLAQDGGHHRLQAIRNLIKAKILPRNFQFPVLIWFSKNAWGIETKRMVSYPVFRAELLTRHGRGEVIDIIKRYNQSMPDLDDYLFHVTSVNYFDSIMQQGLIPELSDFTKEAYIRKLENDYLDRGEEPPNIDELEQIADRLPGYVFATDFDDLPAAIHMLKTNKFSPIPLSEMIVIGIKPSCKSMFEKKEIASTIDLVSEKTISPSCLVLVDKKQWMKIYKENKAMKMLPVTPIAKHSDAINPNRAKKNKALRLPAGFEYAEKPAPSTSKPVTLVEIKAWVKDLGLGKAKDVTTATKEQWLKKIVKAMGESDLTSRASITIEEETGFRSGKKFLPVIKEKKKRMLYVEEGKELGGPEMPASKIANLTPKKNKK